MVELVNVKFMTYICVRKQKEDANYKKPVDLTFELFESGTVHHTGSTKKPVFKTSIKHINIRLNFKNSPYYLLVLLDMLQ